MCIQAVSHLQAANGFSFFFFFTNQEGLSKGYTAMVKLVKQSSVSAADKSWRDPKVEKKKKKKR